MSLALIQARLWFLEQFRNIRKPNNAVLKVKLRGQLNQQALEISLTDIVDRYGLLLTFFVALADEEKQVAQSTEAFVFNTHDLKSMDCDERKGENLSAQVKKIEAFTEEEACYVFNMNTGPLLRAQLLVLGDDNYILLLTTHPIVGDKWFLDTFCQEFPAYYTARSEGKEPSLVASPMQYVDFVLWQCCWLVSSALERKSTYWQDRLQGYEGIQLPTDHSYSDFQNFNRQQETFCLSPTLLLRFQALACEHQCTLFTVLLAALHVLLYRYTGRTDVVIGTLVTDPHYPAIKNIIRFFSDILPLRTKLHPQKTFRALLQQVSEEVLEAYQHRDAVHCSKIIEILDIHDHCEYSPFCQVMLLLLQDAGKVSNLMLPNLEASLDAKQCWNRYFNLVFTFQHKAEGLVGHIEYSTAFFVPETINRLIAHINVLFDAISEYPDQYLNTFPIMTNDEKEQLLINMNQTNERYPEAQTIHQLFEEQVEKTPHNIALVFEEQSLTYSQLNARANQVASTLRSQYLQIYGTNLVPDSTIALCMERSLEMIIGLLGILKAGAAYIPLDPSYPPSRLQYILQDTKALFLVTQEPLFSSFENYTGQVLCLDRDKRMIGQASQDNVLTLTQPHHLIYIIYTSGSTGLPKGVAVEHRSVINLCFAFNKILKLNEHCKSTQFTSLAFDASVWEIFPMLLNGGTLHVLSDEVKHDVTKLSSYIEREGIDTVTFLPPAVLHILPPIMKSALTKVIVGGDKCTQSIVDEWGARVCLINGYGPTEATVCTHVGVCMPNERPHIGKPLSNVRNYILDNDFNPVPVGVVGEVFLGGACLARGYWNQPELTDKHFIPNPFATDEDKLQGKNLRLYRTGDLAKYSSNGNIEILDRIDQQVKIRGFRIECGEIESVLLTHPQIAEAAVIAHEVQGHKHLVAYYVANRDRTAFDFLVEGESLDVATLREYVALRLPEYMVPSYFTSLKSLPLTINGKLDRKLLTDLETDSLSSRSGYVLASTSWEMQLTEILSELVDIKRIGYEDNLLAVGLNSLSSMELRARVHKQIGVELPLKEIWKNSTIRSLARYIKASMNRTTRGNNTFKMEEASTGSCPIPLTFQQEQIWLFEKFMPETRAYQAQFTLDIRGKLNKHWLEMALTEIVKRQAIFRTVVVEKDGRPQQVIHEPWTVQVSEIDLRYLFSAVRSKEVQNILNQNFQEKIDYSRLPLVRWKLYRVQEDYWIFVCIEHHFIHDGFTSNIFLHELQACYEACSRGKTINLPSLSCQYADYAIWQRQETSQHDYQQQISYWINQLSVIEGPLELMVDRPRSSVQSFEGNCLRIRLDGEMMLMLQQLQQTEYVTLFTIMYTVFGLLLFRYTQQERFVLATTVANRDFEEIEHVCGMFVNILPICLNFSANLTFQELLQDVHRRLGEAYTYSAAPFQGIVQQLQRNHRNFSRNPVFEVCFSSHNSKRPSLKFGETMAEFRIEHNGTAKFDLCVITIPTSEETTMLWEYNTDLFEQQTIERMVTHYLNLLKSILKHPQEKVSRLSYLSEIEYHQLLIEWNSKQMPYPQDKVIHQLFEEQVEKTPHNIALVFEEQSLTYSQLNARANQVASTLRSQYLQIYGTNLVPDSTIALCMERSLEMIIGLLGILKAGAAYIPLDPSYPLLRLQYILEDTKAVFLVTQEPLLSSFKNYTGQILCLDRDKTIIAQASEDNVLTLTQPHHLIYIIYTSGSTGQPKGVAVEHRSVINLYFAHNEIFQFDVYSKSTQFASLVFDASVIEIYSILLTGGSLHILSDEVKRDVIKLSNYIEQESIDTLTYLPPAVLQILPPVLGSSLSKVVLGGDRCTQNLVDEWGDKICLINDYGPTEATVFTHLGICSPNERPHVGRPISNVKTYILDNDFNPVPVGVVGEVFLGGACLARGYWNQPELTDKHFIPNPFATDEDKLQGKNLRLYRTGDLAKYLSNGNIEILDRIDQQVKIRGFRIECGEIESVLLAHPQIAEVAVIAHEVQGHKHLVAYYVVKRGSTSSDLLVEAGDSRNVTTLREHVALYLPEYMIPSYFISLKSLPLTGNGKLDRNALPTPHVPLLLEETDYVAPRNEIEAKLKTLWSEVLELKSIGIFDNFFAIGGHSLLIIKLSLVIQKYFHCKCSVKTLFQHPTIAGQAHVIATAQQETVSSENSLIKDALWPIKVEGALNPLFFVHPGFGLCWLYSKLLPYLLPEQPLYGINDPYWGRESTENFRTLESMGAFYVNVIQTVQPSGPYRLGGWSLGGNIAIEMAKLLENKGLSVEIVILIDSFPRKSYKITMATREEEAKVFKEFLSSCYLDELSVNEKEAFEVEYEKFQEMSRHYQQSHYTGCTVLLRADHSCKVPIVSDYNGWENFLCPLPEVYSLTGSHEKIFNSDNVESVANAINQCLVGLQTERRTTIEINRLFSTLSDQQKMVKNHREIIMRSRKHPIKTSSYGKGSSFLMED